MGSENRTGLHRGVVARRLQELVDRRTIFFGRGSSGARRPCGRAAARAGATTTGTRFSRAAPTASPRSFAIRSVVKPGAYRRLDAAPSTMPGTGVHALHDPGAARGFGDHAGQESAGRRRTPRRSRNASADRDRPAEPEIKLLHNLATSPAPTAPTWMMWLPIAASAGRASARLAGVAADHDRQVHPAAGAPDAARHRRVERTATPRSFSRARHPPRGAGIDRRHVDAEPTGWPRGFDDPAGAEIGRLDIRRGRAAS